MVTKKVFGYLVSAVGLVGIVASTFSNVKTALRLEVFSNTVLTVASVVILLIGVLLLKGTSFGGKEKEVPIYRNKEIIGYRRVRK